MAQELRQLFGRSLTSAMKANQGKRTSSSTSNNNSNADIPDTVIVPTQSGNGKHLATAKAVAAASKSKSKKKSSVAGSSPPLISKNTLSEVPTMDIKVEGEQPKAVVPPVTKDLSTITADVSVPPLKSSVSSADISVPSDSIPVKSPTVPKKSTTVSKPKPASFLRDGFLSVLRELQSHYVMGPWNNKVMTAELFTKSVDTVRYTDYLEVQYVQIYCHGDDSSFVCVCVCAEL